MRNLIYDKFSCPRSDLRLRGFLFRPKGAGPFPAVVVGYKSTQGQFFARQYAILLARMGHAVFCYDLDGSETGRRSIATVCEDLKAVIEFAGKQPFTDMDDVCLMGCTGGALAPAVVAAELGIDMVKKLILICPDLPPDSYGTVTGYRGPVLICSGTRDLIEACKAADEAAVASGELKEMPLLVHESIRNVEQAIPFLPRAMDVRNTFKEFMAGRKEVMRVDVKLTTMTFKRKGALLDWDIPFGGKAIGNFFNGTVRSGAHDQRYYGIGTADVTADYYIDGRDCAGEDATVHVVNKGVSRKARAAAAGPNASAKTASPWKPVVSTTSKALDFMNHTEAFARLRQRGYKGPLVRIFMDYEATK